MHAARATEPRGAGDKSSNVCRVAAGFLDVCVWVSVSLRVPAAKIFLVGQQTNTDARDTGDRAAERGRQIQQCVHRRCGFLRCVCIAVCIAAGPWMCFHAARATLDEVPPKSRRRRYRRTKFIDSETRPRPTNILRWPRSQLRWPAAASGNLQGCEFIQILVAPLLGYAG